MIPGIATIVWAYAVARLLQIPVEYQGENRYEQAWLVITSIIGILIASFAWFGVITTHVPTTTMP